MTHDGLARGLHEAAKALDKRSAHLCVLADSCDEPMYVKLVEALCAEHQINLIKVDDNKKLGEWAGLCKIDREGKARKVVRALRARIEKNTENSHLIIYFLMCQGVSEVSEQVSEQCECTSRQTSE